VDAVAGWERSAVAAVREIETNDDTVRFVAGTWSDPAVKALAVSKHCRPRLVAHHGGLFVRTSHLTGSRVVVSDHGASCVCCGKVAQNYRQALPVAVV
jgi:hypothetical protein